jgi:GT2 family glycosyltransferase
MKRENVAVVLGTYNRLEMLKESLASIGRAATKHALKIIVIDGGSTDGTLDYLKMPSALNITLVRQRELTGAVRAFNIGFGWAVDAKHPFVVHMNDDAIIETPGAIDEAVDLMLANQKIGAVAFAFDTWGHHHFDHVNGVPYVNYGVIRTKAGMQVAKKQGDPDGRKWWNQIYHTYAADTELGAWLWKLGWRVHCCEHLKVHDLRADDALRAGNSGPRQEADSKLFWSRWEKENLEQYLELNK